MDVKSTFLHGDLQEEIYMEQPPGYIQHPSCMGICKKKSTCNNLLATSKMTLALYVASRNFFMALSKTLGLGMLKWIDFL